jgi:hypothetical protein
MLLKKELEQVPVLKFPKITAKEIERCRFAASAKLTKLLKSGNILIVDIFEANSHNLRLRFFCDGVNYLVCEEWPNDSWKTKKPEKILECSNMASTKKDNQLAVDFFLSLVIHGRPIAQLFGG